MKWKGVAMSFRDNLWEETNLRTRAKGPVPNAVTIQSFYCNSLDKSARVDAESIVWHLHCFNLTEEVTS